MAELTVMLRPMSGMTAMADAIARIAQVRSGELSGPALLAAPDSERGRVSEPLLRERVQRLSRLFKFEFMFRADATFDGRDRGRVLELAQRKTPTSAHHLNSGQATQTVFDVRQRALTADKTTFATR